MCQLISKKPGDPGGIGKLGRLAAEVRCFFTQLQSLTLIDPGYGESWETYDTALYRWHVAKNGGSHHFVHPVVYPFLTQMMLYVLGQGWVTT